MTSFSQGGFFIETKGEREITAQTSFGACGSCIDNSGSDTAGSISDAEGVYSGILGDCGAPDCRDSSGVDCGETLRGNRGAGRSDRCWIVSDLALGKACVNFSSIFSVEMISEFLLCILFSWAGSCIFHKKKKKNTARNRKRLSAV